MGESRGFWTHWVMIQEGVNVVGHLPTADMITNGVQDLPEVGERLYTLNGGVREHENIQDV